MGGLTLPGLDGLGVGPGMPAPGFGPGVGPNGLPMPSFAPGSRNLPTPGFAPGLPAPGFAPAPMNLPVPGFAPRPVSLPFPGYAPPSQPPAQGPQFVAHPFVRAPRDFFMWSDVMQDQISRTQRPSLVP